MSVPGSCGELAQGIYRGRPYLVTCPIDAYTTVTVSDKWQGLEGLGEKSLQSLRQVLAYLGKDIFPYGMKLASELPPGKGMASSSADIAAVAAAASAALGRRLSAEEIMDIAVSIEPTDAVFFPGIVCVNQVTGEVYARYRDLPRLKITVFDTGGTVDTVDFHGGHETVGEELPPPVFAAQAPWHLAPSLARAAEKSAFANQSLLEKRGLRDLSLLARRWGALGVNVAHSGTVIGVLWPEDMKPARVQEASLYLADNLSSVTLLRQARLTSGGVFYS